MEEKKPRELKGKAVVPYEVAMGKTWNDFYTFLKENKIMGKKCSVCDRVYVPPRSFCPNCFEEMEKWVEVGPYGRIDAWALINFPFYGQILKIPYISAQIRLDGAGTAFTHQIGGIDMSDYNEVRKKVKLGDRVRAVWSEEKKGSILDLSHFEIVEE
jgi:hypothetical protein